MSGISQEFTTFGFKNCKSGKFLTYTRCEIPLLKIVFKLKFFLAKHESYIILKVFKVKVLSVFGFDTFLTMLNALWWIYKKVHHGIFDFMFLVSSVLVMVSKNLLFCFRPGHLELFQCSAEGWVWQLKIYHTQVNAQPKRLKIFILVDLLLSFGLTGKIRQHTIRFYLVTDLLLVIEVHKLCSQWLVMVMQVITADFF